MNTRKIVYLFAVLICMCLLITGCMGPDGEAAYKKIVKNDFEKITLDDALAAGEYLHEKGNLSREMYVYDAAIVNYLLEHTKKIDPSFEKNFKKGDQHFDEVFKLMSATCPLIEKYLMLFNNKVREINKNGEELSYTEAKHRSKKLSKLMSKVTLPWNVLPRKMSLEKNFDASVFYTYLALKASTEKHYSDSDRIGEFDKMYLEGVFVTLLLFSLEYDQSDYKIKSGTAEVSDNLIGLANEYCDYSRKHGLVLDKEKLVKKIRRETSQKVAGLKSFLKYLSEKNPS